MSKRKHPRGARTPEGSARTGTTATRGRPTEVPPIKPAPAQPGGPNRLARKEEARRRREALQRKTARRRLYRTVAVILAVAVVGAAVAGYVLTRPDPAAAAGCTDVMVNSGFADAGGQNLDQAHIGGETGPAEMPDLSEYPSVPPASGPHNNQPLPAGVYDTAPDIGQAIHSLEHGGVIVWFSSTVPNSQLEELRTFVDDPDNQDHLIMALYDYPDQGAAGQLPRGRSMALAAWHRVQLCDKVSADVVESFVDRFRIRTGEAPPPGYPTQNGAPEPGAPLA
jgi:hypothetical protein